MNLQKIVFLGLCFLILIDTFLPGKTHHSTITSISINYESYFNAGGNGHDSYAIVTEKHDFFIDESEKDNFSKGDDINYRLSPMFKEIQVFESDEHRGRISSLRLYTGTIFPLLFTILILLSFRFKERMSILTFVSQVVIIADLIYLLN